MSVTHGTAITLEFLDELRRDLRNERRRAATVLPCGIEDVRAIPLDKFRLLHALGVLVGGNTQTHLGITKAEVHRMHDLYFYEGDRAAVNTLIMAILAIRCAVNECPAPSYRLDREASVYYPIE